MNVYCIDHACAYEAGNVARLFFEQVDVLQGEPAGNEECIVTRVTERDGACIASALVRLNGRTVEKNHSEPLGSDTAERILGKAMFFALTELTSVRPPWGILTGVRPIRLTERAGESAWDTLTRKSLVTEEKARLALCTAERERDIIALSRPDSFSLYIGIPFCPSRCSYCSFVSKTIENAGKLVDDYVDKLVKDIALTGETVSRLGLRLETVYYGGGTPTTLTAAQLSRIAAAIADSFDLTHLREYTVEGGRPETLTDDKLAALIDAGCDRLSINPQTMHDDVLAACGRRHTVQDVYDAYALASRYPFRTINMDLIAGLPADTAAGFASSLDAVVDLSPANVTVHTLCIKRAAYLKSDRPPLPSDADVTAMLSYAASRLEAAGYEPYYLYRQRNTLANAENTGWSRPGHACLYNVYIMDQTHTVLACGAGGVNILRDPHGTKIERVFHYKYPYEYISRLDTLMSRKNDIVSFYERHRVKECIIP